MSYKSLSETYPNNLSYLSYHKFLINYQTEQPTTKDDMLKQVCTVDGVCGTWAKDPKKWGPHLWAYMHYAAANYPDNPSEKDIREMINWLCALPVTIPCDSCRIHYRRYIETNKPILPQICSDKTKLFNFLVDIHNKVNERNNKPTVTYEQARKIYS